MISSQDLLVFRAAQETARHFKIPLVEAVKFESARHAVFDILDQWDDDGLIHGSEYDAALNALLQWSPPKLN